MYNIKLMITLIKGFKPSKVVKKNENVISLEYIINTAAECALMHDALHQHSEYDTNIIQYLTGDYIEFPQFNEYYSPIENGKILLTIASLDKVADISKIQEYLSLSQNFVLN